MSNKTKIKIIYKDEDGIEFDSQEAAIISQAILDLGFWMESYKRRDLANELVAKGYILSCPMQTLVGGE